MEEEINKDMENHTKKNKTNPENKNSLSHIRNTVESHSSRLEQVEDRISGLEDSIVIQEKTRRILRQKTEELLKDIQELCNSIKRSNFQIMDIKSGENVQVKDLGNITNKVIAENIPNLKREIPIQVLETSRTPNRHDKNRNSQQLAQRPERIWKRLKERKNCNNIIFFNINLKSKKGMK
jgi:uncharacterized protein YoxC